MEAEVKNEKRKINILSYFQRTDIAFAIGLMLIMAILILPLPGFLMDFALSMSIAFSFMIFMTSLFIEKPLEFSSFPTVLLVSTMGRLSLNVASTRLILSHGHEGPSAAGRVIQAFGKFIMGGNFVIGIIVFSILVIVNFIVITKGSGRIAEVSARFSLDAMPGKQMAIDADLSSGLIDEDTAKRRRKELEGESNFYGAMDGAAKFVRGDAIAGILITFINVIGGIIIGVVQNNLTASQAAHTYTLLTVGDGLVSQIPALIVSMAAGMLVSKAGVEGPADKALVSQLSAYPTAMGLSSLLLGIISLFPGVPMIPFLSLSAATGYLSWKINEKIEDDKQKEVNKKIQQENQKQIEMDSPKEITKIEELDALKIEIGYDLLPFISDKDGQKLTKQIKNLREQMAKEMGFMLPPVKIQDNIQLPGSTYVLKIKDIEIARGDVFYNKLLVIDPYGNPINIEGNDTVEPTFGLKAKWIDKSMQDEAESLNYTVVDSVTVITTHMGEIVKENISDLLSFEEVQKLLDNLSESYKKLLNDIVPGQISVAGIQRVLQNLIKEGISIRDLTGILEGIAESVSFTRNVTLMTEHVRGRLARQITISNLDENQELNIITMSSHWEQKFQESLVGDGEIKQLAIAPSELHEFFEKFNEEYERFEAMGKNIVFVVNPSIRPYIVSVFERISPKTIIISQNEVFYKAKINTLGSI